jgi:STE24 endopeptidase
MVACYVWAVMTWFALVTVGLIVARGVAQFWLDGVNRRHVLAHADAVPSAFAGIMDEATYRKSVQYTLAKSRLSQVEMIFDAGVLGVVLFSGVLPWAFGFSARHYGTSAWAMAGCLWLTTVAMSLLSLPLEWYAQFHLEARFGFNTTTLGLWFIDRLKALLLGLVIGYPLLVLIVKIIGWTGEWWWLWAWAALMGFQLLMLILAPVLILPLFNKFTPLPEGNLRERLLELARRTGFLARSIQVMDGSKRSRHSNAFFTGFGKFRKIVLFDTLLQQLTEPELEAVLAHEIGHYRRKHILKFLLLSAGMALAAFYLLSVLAQQPWFFEAFGFRSENIVPALLLFALLSGLGSFWLSPLLNMWSRRYEYQADAFAAKAMKESESLVGALRKLNEKNLSNLTPHPLYSGFYYSHPTLLEREQALMEAYATSRLSR